MQIQLFLFMKVKKLLKKKKHFSIHSLPKEPLKKFVSKTWKNNVYSTRWLNTKRGSDRLWYLPLLHQIYASTALASMKKKLILF